MGALRAAELADFGMIGVGQIFHAYHRGEIRDDDEVAVLHGPAELGYPPLSEPMVSIRATVQSALAQGVISDAAANRILRCAKALHYKQRSWERMAGELVDEKAFFDWLPVGKTDAKRVDAIEMISEMAAHIETPRASQPAHRMERTLVWHELVGRIEAEVKQDLGGDSAVLDELRLRPDNYAVAADRAALRQLSRQQAQRDGAVPERSELLAQMALHRQHHDLGRRSDVLRWMHENDLDEAGYEALLTDSYILQDATGQDVQRALIPDLIAQLRWSGEYAGLKARMQKKHDWLEDQGQTAKHISAQEQLNILIWYFETVLDRDMPRDLDAHARSLGLADRAEFCKLVMGEYLFCRAEGGE